MNPDRIISIISIIITIISIFVSIFFGVSYYNLKNSVAAINSPGAEVIGGNKITANNINIEKPARHLTEDLKNNLDSQLEMLNAKNIRVVAVMGDQEAFQFATEIKDYLESKNWVVSGVDQAVYTKPVIGQSLQDRGNGVFEVIVGGQQ